MKKAISSPATLLLLVSIFICASVSAQELKRVEHNTPLLKTEGEEEFSFEITSLKDDTYKILFEVKEYGKENLAGCVVASVESVKRNRLSEITIGFPPAADSLKTVSFFVDNAEIATRSLALKPLDGPRQRFTYYYKLRPFKVGAFQLDVFTPLVLAGSFWFDEQAGVYRFCSEREFPSDMSSASLKYIPHYYVIGVTITRITI